MRQYCLSDVDDLGGALADDMHAQKLQAGGIEDQLQKALIVAQHLSFCQLRVTRDAGLVGNLVAA